MVPVSEERFLSLELKIDKLSDAVLKLVLIDERQIAQGQRVGKIEEDIGKLRLEMLQLERTVSKWMNFVWGAWVVIGAGWALFSRFYGG